MICIKKDKYGSMYVPKEEKAPKEGKKPEGESALDQIREDIERMKDESIKKNRDNLDALYNIDTRNMSPSMRRLFASWTDGIKKANASVETIANSQEAVVKLVAQYDENIAAIQATANSNSASISSIVKWQGETEESIASIRQSASDNEASITQLVEVIGEDGETITASIKTAVINDESFIELVADRVTIEGTAEFVTRDELSDRSGTTTISGNLLELTMIGQSDTGNNELYGESKLHFNYWTVNGGEEKEQYIARIFAYASGTDTDVSSRYSLRITTEAFVNKIGEAVYPAIKLQAAGNISMDGNLVYIYGYDQAVIAAKYNARIRAGTYYSNGNSWFPEASTDYVFASDGIYYNGRLLIST